MSVRRSAPARSTTQCLSRLWCTHGLICAVSHAAREQRATIADVFRYAARAAVAGHGNSGLDTSFPNFERTVRCNIALDIAAMIPLARHHGVECFGAGLKVAGRLPRNPINGRQGKKPAVGAAHVVGKIEEFTNVTNTRCWRFLQIGKRIQSSERRRFELLRGAGP
jgi:hypothetical protein